MTKFHGYTFFPLFLPYLILLYFCHDRCIFLVMLVSKEMKKLTDWQEKELLNNKCCDILGQETTVLAGKGLTLQ